MYTSLRSFAVAALWVSGAFAAVPAVKPTYVRCGADSPPAELVAAAQHFSAQAAAPAPQVAINVRTYFHVVTSTAKKGLYTQTQLNNQ
ncbi:MAG: hypothetical protein L6R41_008411, partial [Letrouitia leprolyta]